MCMFCKQELDRWIKLIRNAKRLNFNLNEFLDNTNWRKKK